MISPLYTLHYKPSEMFGGGGKLASTLKKLVNSLSFPRSRVWQPQGNRQAADTIHSYLTECGYQVSRNSKYENLVALPKNFRGDNPLTLVCAHYDTAFLTNGADDNASAIAVMLVAAKQCTSSHVAFVAFNAEEEWPGFKGSFAFVRWCQAKRIDIQVAHVLEMVGYCDHSEGSQRRPIMLPVRIPSTGNFLGLVASSDSMRQLVDTVEIARAEKVNLPLVGLGCRFGVEKFLPFLLRSDHVPFWYAHLPAIMWTDTANYRNPHYHRMSDLPDTLDYSFMEQVALLLIAVLAHS